MGAKRQAARQYGKQVSGALQGQSDLAQQMFDERARYGQQAESLLGQAPQYYTPGQIYDYQKLMQQSGQQLGSQLAGIAGDLRSTDYTQAGQDALTKGYGEAVGYANQGATSLRDIMRRGVDESAGYAKTGMETGLKDTNTFVDFYRRQAARDQMPGQQALESKLGRSYAEGYKALGQQSGGSASGLGAMIDLYTNKSEALSDLGIQAAQYKAQQEQQLGAALQNAQAIRSQIYDTAAQGSMSRAGAMAGAEQTATGLQVGAAQGQADALSQYALNRQGAAQNQAATLANITNQGITGQANLQGAGLLTAAEYQDMGFQYNQLMPYQNSLNYYMSQISSMNPYGAQSDVYNNQMSAINNLYSLFGKRGRSANINT